MRFRFFAITAPGLEEVAGRELAAVGIEGTAGPGGIEWTGDLESLYLANLHLRTASRIILRVAEFKARSFIELERHLRRVAWKEHLAVGSEVRFRVTSRKSRLYHERAIEERFAREIGSALGTSIAAKRDDADESDDEEETEPDDAQLLIVRFVRDRCVVSADASGALLHRRGYRQAVARAPLRETLGAAMLLASGWTPEDALLDPFCGAGTVPIEAALIARDIPPALANEERTPRAFAFERWPSFEPALWERLVREAQTRIRDGAEIEIRGSDRDAGAIDAARANAARAGVDGDIRFDVRALSAAEAESERGWIVTNPPYGVRVGDPAPLRDLYAALGNLMRTKLPGWRLAMLAADEPLLRQTGLDFDEPLTTTNGGIPVRLVVHRGG